MHFKEFFSVYPDSIDNYHLWGALAFFSIFLIFVLTKKLASGEGSVSRLSRLHFKFFIPYLLLSFVYSLVDGKVNNYPLGSFLSGAFIYFSLFYIYLLSLISLARKSISVHLMGHIQDFSPEGECTQEKLLRQYLSEKNGLEYMRQNGLNKMVQQHWAKEKGSTFYITEHGRNIAYFTNGILKILNLVRY